MSRPLLYIEVDSPGACAVRMLANIIGLELDLNEVDMDNLEHKSPAYLKLNPMGTIPVLIDGDFVLSDSHAILKYLVSQYGGDKRESLYPSDLRKRAIVDQVLFFDTGSFFVRIYNVIISAASHGATGPSEAEQKAIAADYRALEAYLTKHTYVAADNLTIADLSLVATIAITQIALRLDPEIYPRGAAWFSKMSQEPYFKKIMVPGVEFLDKYMIDTWESNKKK